MIRAGNPATVMHACTLETRTWDRAGRVSDIRHTRGTTTFAFTSYVRDAAGNPTSQTSLDGTVAYSYDSRHRITQACYTPTCTGIAPDGGGTFVRYTYDGVGNRLTQQKPLGTTTYTYNAPFKLQLEMVSQTSPTRGRVGAVLGAPCVAVYSPAAPKLDHWHVDCGGPERTKQTLSEYAKAHQHHVTPNERYHR